MKKVLFSLIVFCSILNASNIRSPNDPVAGSWYTDEFGPTRSNYSIGDFVRYTITPGSVVPLNPVDPKNNSKPVGLNIYYNMVEIPYAQDAFNGVHNTENLYNFIGNLYAGYCACNMYPTEFNIKEWLTSFRMPNQWQSGSLGFDNNPCGIATVYLDPGCMQNAKTRNMQYNNFVINVPERYQTVDHLYDNSRSPDQGQWFLGGFYLLGDRLLNANASCAWNTNTRDGNYVLAEITNRWNNYAAPYGQYWGTRLSHILGAVTNDVPASKAAAISSTWMAMPTGTPTPPVAIFSGGPAAVAGSTVPSTAHYGSLMNFVNYWMSNKVTPAIKNSTYYSYIAYHLLPTLQRFATGATSDTSSAPLCSYQLTATATGANLIEIVDANMTAYDNGVIVDIQNNTGKSLYVKQCVKGVADNQIGILKPGSNNYFLNTASLMQSSSNNTNSSQPPSGNLIEFKDLADGANAYVQVMNPTQLQTLVTTLNNALNNLSSSANASNATNASANNSANNFVYNQNANNAYQQPTSTNTGYLVVTNFDSNNVTQLQGNNLIMARVQAIDIGAFEGQPYFITLKIDKEQIGYGIAPKNSDPNAPVAGSVQNPYVFTSGVPNSFILYPSIVSAKTFSWLNPYAQTQGSSYYSQIPLLLLPDLVTQAGIKGLAANYGIWLMSYAAALREFQFHCEFGNTLECLSKIFQTFAVTNQSAPARVVIDANNILQSAQTMMLLKTATDQQSNATYLTLMGSDVWDCGQNFHQDIPVLHLYADAAGNPVANQQAAEYTNLLVSFELEKTMPMKIHRGITTTATSLLHPANTISTVAQAPVIEEEVEVSTQLNNFADGYGQPYDNVMLFSVPTADLKQGVRVEWLQLAQNYYQIILKDETEAHNVLAVQKVVLKDQGQELEVFINFMNHDDAQWDCAVTIPEVVTNSPIGHTRSCLLKYSDIDGQNRLSLEPVSTLVDKKRKNFGQPSVKIKKTIAKKPENKKIKEKKSHNRKPENKQLKKSKKETTKRDNKDIKKHKESKKKKK